MSTIATTNIKEPSSATNNITLTSGGDTTISGNATVTGTLNNLTYPTADGTAGQVLKTDGSGTLSFASPLTYDTAHTFDNTTNEKTFTGIPSTAKRITMMVQGVSPASNASAQMCVRVGTSAGLNTSTIYSYSTSYGSFLQTTTTGSYFGLSHDNYTADNNAYDGIIQVVKLSTTENKWVFSAQLTVSGGYVNESAGSIDLSSGVLDRIQLLHGGAINYDAGTVNIMYES